MPWVHALIHVVTHSYLEVSLVPRPQKGTFLRPGNEATLKLMHCVKKVGLNAMGPCTHTCSNPQLL